MTTPAFDSATQKNVNQWLSGAYDQETKEALQKMLQSNPKQVIDSFYTNLAFGTGGLRGLMGIGTNRMNPYTVGAATQGLANYLLKQPVPVAGFSVVIGYDSRHHSRLFAEEASKVLAGNGIKVYLFASLRPTPLVSFTCRLKKCSAGIVITASHNPPDYNGYKVYWNDGAQILPPHDKGIIQEVEKISDAAQVKKVDIIDHPLIEKLGEQYDHAYVEAIYPLQFYPDDNKQHGKELSIVYTSLHGTGITMVPLALKSWGFSNIHLVAEQVIPDGSFPTVTYPNPEDPKALKMGMELLQKQNADLLIATDPDTDRVGIVVNHKGSPYILNGNQIASICAEHICNFLCGQNKMPANGAFIKTIATTELFKAIADSYKIPCFDVLTGFKYVAELINYWENHPQGYQFIFGGEESYGYLLGTVVRDKDAIVSSALICEIALQAKLKGRTLIDLLYDLYRRHGVYSEGLMSVDFPETKEGKEKMAAAVLRLQNSPPHSINGIPVVTLEDYKRSIKTILTNGQTEPITLTPTNCLVFWLKDGSKVMVRPSGTEPKIKIYCGVVMKPLTSIENTIKESQAHCDNLMAGLKQILI